MEHNSEPFLRTWVPISLAILCGLAILEMPGWFYQFLRWIIFVGSGSLSAQFLYLEKDRLKWATGIVSIIFNPVIPFYLEKEIWVIIDLVSIMVFLAAGMTIWKFRKPEINRKVIKRERFADNALFKTGQSESSRELDNEHTVLNQSLGQPVRVDPDGTRIYHEKIENSGKFRMQETVWNPDEGNLLKVSIGGIQTTENELNEVRKILEPSISMNSSPTEKDDISKPILSLGNNAHLIFYLLIGILIVGAFAMFILYFLQ